MLAARSVTSGKVLHENVETPIGSAYRLEFVSELLFCSWYFFNLKAKRSAFVWAAASLSPYPTLRVRGFGGQSFAGFPWLRGLWCIECAESLEWLRAGLTEMQQLTQGLNREGWADTGLAHQYYCLSNIMHVTVFILKINILSFSVQYNNSNNNV